MKKLIKFLFLILFAHYVLGQNCKEATYDNIGGVEGCFNLETAKKMQFAYQPALVILVLRLNAKI